MVSTLATPELGERGQGSEDPRPRRARPYGRSRRARQLGRALPLLPTVVLLIVFLVGPIITSFYGSFTNISLTGPTATHPSFIGFDNYINLFSTPGFSQAAMLTLVFVFLSAVVGQNIMGMILALLMRSGNRVVSAIVSTAVVGAWVVPDIVSAFASYAFFSTHGTLNELLAPLGITGPDWLYVFPMASVILANTWRGTAFSMLVYSAALQDVPPEITEAAEMDGASGLKRFLQITLPMIRGSISTNLMLITLSTLSAFTLIYVMTAGGPGTASTTLPLLAYQQAFKFSELGYGTAIATILLIVGAVFSIIYIRALKPEVD
jgi:multiple sugar transport system permease protein